MNFNIIRLVFPVVSVIFFVILFGLSEDYGMLASMKNLFAIGGFISLVLCYRNMRDIHPISTIIRKALRKRRG